MNTETNTKKSNHHNRANSYELPFDDVPDWNNVEERLDILAIPDDPHERADDVTKNLAGNGTDIEAFMMAIHQVLMPSIESSPTHYPMKVGGKELMQPEDRSSYYDRAAECIRQLDTMRNPDGNDDAAFLERAGNIIGFTVVGSHAFANGNGRTARVLGELVRNGRTEPEDMKVYGTERPEHGFRVFSYVPKNNNTSANDLLATATRVDIPFAAQDQYNTELSQYATTPYYG